MLHRSRGHQHFQARVYEVRGEGAESGLLEEGDHVSAVVHGDLADRLATRFPDASVQREPPDRGGSSHLLGWWVPQWFALVVLGLVVAGLGLLRHGPTPWRATRWAWFWLMLTPVGTALFLVGSGPTPFVPAPRDVSRRLTGGGALLLAIVLGNVFGSWF